MTPKTRKIIIAFISLLLILLCIPWPGQAAENPTATITITAMVVARTCSFDEASQTVTLDDLSSKEFTDSQIRGQKSFTVGVSCDAGIKAVSIVPSGASDSDDATAFSNTGDSSNVALRLLGEENQVLNPNGTDKVALSLNESGDKASYTFQAGYVATGGGKVTAGGFSAMVNLNFDYS